MEDFFSPDVINASYTQWHLRYEELWQVLVLISWWRLSGAWEKGLALWPIASEGMVIWGSTVRGRRLELSVPGICTPWLQPLGLNGGTPALSLIVNWGAQYTGNSSQRIGVWVNYTDSILSAPSQAPSPTRPYPLHVTAYSQGMRLSQINSLSACTFAFIWHENWKNECLLLTQMVGPETSREGEGGNLFLSPVPTGVGMPLHSSQIRILTLAPLKPPVPLSKCSCKCLWPLPVCKLPKVNFVIALCGVAYFIFQSRNSFSVWRISLTIPTSQHQIRGLPPSTQIYYFSLFK